MHGHLNVGKAVSSIETYNVFLEGRVVGFVKRDRKYTQ